MPVDFGERNKGPGSSVYPLYAIGTAETFERVGPIVTPQDIRDQWLFGIPLVSPLTKQQMTDKLINEIITRAINSAEMALNITIIETQREWRIPYDRALASKFMFIELPFRPVRYLNSLYIESADQVNIYEFPPQIIETKNLHLGQISLGFANTPGSFPSQLMAAAGGAGAGVLLLQNFYNTTWAPAFFTAKFVTGFPPNEIPIIINELIATFAAIEILSKLGPLYARVNSSSLSIDGLSQSTSGPGAQLYATRIGDLTARKMELINQIRSYFYSQIQVLNI